MLHAPGDARVTEECLRSVREALSKRKQSSNAEDSIDIRVTALPILGDGGEMLGDAVSADARGSARLFKRSAEARLAPASETGTAKDVPERFIQRPITLNDRDVETLRFFVCAFATETLLPHMERRLASLNRTVAAARRG